MISKIKILLILFLTSIIFTCCVSNVTDPEAEANYFVQGKIKNWSGVANKTLTVRIFSGSATPYALSSAKINSDGSFNLPLSAPPSSILYNYNVEYSGCTGDLQVSDPSARVADFSLIDVYEGNKRIGSISKETEFAGSINKYSSSGWLYADKPFTLSGTEACEQSVIKTYTTGAASFQKEWNEFYTSFSRTDTTVYITITTAEPSGLVWIFSSN